MILHQFVHRARGPFDSGCRPILPVSLLLQLGHQGQPVGLDDLGGAEVEELLDEDQHTRPQGPDAALPNLEPRRRRAAVNPDDATRVRLPSRRELGLDVPEREQVPEQGLVPPHRLAADDERHGEGYGIVELQRREAARIPVALDGVVRSDRRQRLALFNARDVHDALQRLDERDLVHLHLDVLFEGVERDDAARLA